MVIKECNQDDYNTIINYIGDDYYKCLYLYLDVKKYFYKNKNLKVYIDYDSSNSIQAIIMQYYSTIHIFSRNNNICYDRIIELIKKIKPSMICAEKRIIESLSNIFNEQYNTEYGVIRKMSRLITDNVDLDLELADEQDFDKIVELIMTDKGLSCMQSFEELKDQLLSRYNDGFCRNFVYKQNGLMIGHVCSGAENEKLTILTDLVINPNFRRRGYGKKICESFCKIMQSEKKEIYLVSYTNIANALYESIGFDICCNWGKMYIDISK